MWIYFLNAYIFNFKVGITQLSICTLYAFMDIYDYNINYTANITKKKKINKNDSYKYITRLANYLSKYMRSMGRDRFIVPVCHYCTNALCTRIVNM